MFACEIIMGVVIATQMTPEGTFPTAAAYGLIAVVCVFIAGHAWGWGPMAWLIISEVSPMEVRPAPGPWLLGCPGRVLPPGTLGPVPSRFSLLVVLFRSFFQQPAA
jgi:hypothetical protein